ncbi:hypothetical protein PBPMD00_33 [Pinkberry virus LS07-2018-MD00]|jgi:hypothetical protein|nr:hypothetical protein PBPMD00_33 [Pinkberry virus LS07-2018-MD00]
MSNYWFVLGKGDLEVALVNLNPHHYSAMIRSSLAFMDVVAAVIEFNEGWTEDGLKQLLPDAEYIKIDCRCKADAAITVVTSFEDVKDEGDIMDLRDPWFFGDYCRIEDEEHNFTL